MSVDDSIESFAFALFRKLWIRNGLPDYAEMVPDYPVVTERDCPDYFCDTVFAFQCLSSSFFEELVKQDYYFFARSRSDFFEYIFPTIMSYRGEENCLNNVFSYIVSLAVTAAEMGIACFRRDNNIFIFTAPLAFAMVFEYAYGTCLNSVGHRAFWGLISKSGSSYPCVRSLAGIVGRSASSRRDLIYRLSLLRLEMYGKCPDELYNGLGIAIRAGAFMDNSNLPIQRFSIKHTSAMRFAYCLESVNVENFLAPLYTENFIKRHDFSRNKIFQEIATLCYITDESQKEFFALYEESVFGERAVIPPQRKMISDSSSAQELHDLDPNGMVSREMHVVGRDPDNRDAACRPEKLSGIISDNPSLYELYDLQPKSRDPQDHCSLDIGNTEHRPEQHSGIVSEGELNNLKPKDLKSRDPHERDIRHPEEHSSHECEDVQSSDRMESLSKVEEKMKEDYGDESSRSLDIFYKLHNMTDSQVDDFENSKLPRSSSDASETKDQEVAIDANASETKDQEVAIDANASEFNDQEVAIDTSASEFKDQEVAIDTSASEHKEQEIAIDTNVTELKYQEAAIDTSVSELKELEGTIDPDSPELKHQEEITSTRVSKLRDQGIFISTTFELKDSEISDDVNRDNPEVKNRGISISSKLNDQDLMTSFGYSNTLKLNENEVIDENCLETEEVLKEPGSSDLPSIMDVYSIKPAGGAFLQIESSLETSPNSSANSVFTVGSVETYCLKMADGNIKKVFLSESPPREATDPPLELPMTKANIMHVEALEQQYESPVKEANARQRKFAEEFNTEHNDYENYFCNNESVQVPSSPESPRKDLKSVSGEKMDSDPKQKEANIISPQLQKSPTKDEQVKSSLTEGDCYKLFGDVSGAINEDEDKSDNEGKKRKNNQDTGKETEEPTILENGPEKSEIIESNVYQLILVMGAPFEKPIKRGGRFMDRISIDSL